MLGVPILGKAYDWDPSFFLFLHPIISWLLLVSASAVFVLGFVYLLVRVIKLAWKK